MSSSFAASITKNAEKKIQEELVKDIEDQLHQQADEYFAKPFYKR